MVPFLKLYYLLCTCFPLPRSFTDAYALLLLVSSSFISKPKARVPWVVIPSSGVVVLEPSPLISHHNSPGSQNDVDLVRALL
jgi:hypothetical protein